MSSKKSDEEKLPDGWVLCSSKSNPGRKYYFNKKTGKSLWTQPQESGNQQQNVKKDKSQPKSKEESNKKGTKRKSGNDEDLSSTKKQKQESSEANKSVPDIPSVHQLNKTILPKTPTKPSPSKIQAPKLSKRAKRAKNLANARLADLRAKLSNELVEENIPSSARKKKHVCHETPKKTSKSPSDKQNQSPESLHSIPSPSQFLAANKIICSMKAQLPEKYTNKDKQIDTFADIEKGICNQTPEYPFSKHPATPPQFSEASKLVSAIKSKLGYKQKYSAQERLDSLRNNLSSDIEPDFNSSQSEAMDVEDFREVRHSTPMTINSVPPPRPHRDTNDKSVVLVVDTNIFIHQLDIIKDVLNSHIKGYSEQPTLLVPWRVINELDRLKDNNNGKGAVCKRARAAMDYLYKSLPENSRIKGQSLRDANCHIYPCESPDDEILNCALQQVERGKNVLVVSNDKNLCNKARINSMKHINITELRGMLEDKPQPAAEVDYATFLHLKDTIYPLLANILESEMRAKYDNLWQYVIFKAPPWSLEDVLQCLLKHWIAVFNEVFPRIEQLITDLQNSLVSLQKKDPKTVSRSEVALFKELCLDVAKKCQIIPEYMELAKTCVERLSKESEEKKEEKTDAVVDVFECLWTVCSSYCAKLATSAGITHSLEDRIPGEETLPLLTEKWNFFSGHINSIARDTHRVLAVEENGSCNILEEAISELERSLKNAMSYMCSDKTISRQELRVFCSKCRNMLHEASNKFSQLSELLVICRNTLSH